MGISRKLERINDEILREVANIIRNELDDPRIEIMTSVTKVDTTNDLKLSKVFVSIFGNDEEKKDAMIALGSASGHIRTLIAKRINLRRTPEFQFIIDDSLDYSDKINKLIKEANIPKED